MLTGMVETPADKSISHRAVIIASMAIGVSYIHGLLESEDVFSSIHAMRALGAKIDKNTQENYWKITGVGPVGFHAPHNVINMGNSGTSTRLIIGAVASHNFDVFISGDESLSRRPMGRVTEPLALGGASSRLSQERYLPLQISGSEFALPIEYQSNIASAQIKSALLLYGLNVAGTTRILEPSLSRDHSEIMLKHFGADIICEQTKDGFFQVSLTGVQRLVATDITIAGDISSAAFLIAASLIVEGSNLLLTNVGLNPTRTGLLDVLLRMGADITISNEHQLGGEKVGDVRVRHSQLKAIEIEPEIAPRMIDEYPILAVIAAFAEGKTKMQGLAELTVKESNRLKAVVEGLQLVGVQCDYGDDWLEVSGNRGKQVRGTMQGISVKTAHDHRIAMSFLIIGLHSERGVHIDDVSAIATSFPNFFQIFEKLGFDLIRQDDNNVEN